MACGYLGVESIKYRVRVIDSIGENLRGYLDSKGFYDAKFSIKKSSDNIIIKIDEKQPVIVNELKINSDYPLNSLISFKKGDRFDTEQFVEIKKVYLKGLYFRDGILVVFNLSTKGFWSILD